MKYSICPRDPTTASGFSLIELLVTIAILGTLAQIGLPGVQQIRLMSSLDSGQRVVSSALLRGRWLAINRGQQHTVTLSGGNLVQIRSGGAGGTVVQSASLSDFDCTVASSDTPFSFDGRGFLLSGSSKTLTITQPSLPASKTVVVNYLGKVSTP
jgi:prepilin-type N-terminal cleavage/methylation domain-containing protein